MGKKLISGFVIVFVLTTLLSYIPVNFSLKSAFYNTIFTVIGIFYSIGYSIALGFDFNRIQNKEFAFKIRSEVKHVMHSFTGCLTVAIFLFIVINFTINDNTPVVFQKSIIRFSLNIFFAGILIYLLIFLVYNFFRLQKFKDDIDDKIREDNK